MKISLVAIIATSLLVISGSANADPIADIEAMVKNSKGDCLNCHQVDRKIVGPTWKDVATKYKGDATAQEKLVTKVIKGGSGNWNNDTGGLPMTPHPIKPTKEEIEQIVASILQL
jgi:cytochrome c